MLAQRLVGERIAGGQFTDRSPKRIHSPTPVSDREPPAVRGVRNNLALAGAVNGSASKLASRRQEYAYPSRYR